MNILFTVTFDQFNACLLNKIKEENDLTDHKHLNNSV